MLSWFRVQVRSRASAPNTHRLTSHKHLQPQAHDPSFACKFRAVVRSQMYILQFACPVRS